MKRHQRDFGIAAILAALIFAGFCASVSAADGVEAVKQAPPAKLSEEVKAALAPTAYKVTADGKLVCEIWLAKEWPAKEKFTSSLSVLYPFKVGALVGVIRFPKRANDFRNQQFRAGVFTLRYGLQPEDGNHVGTSDTRDFLVLLPAAKDQKAEALPEKEMFKLSAEVTGTTHPGILSMVSVPDKAQAPAVRHIQERDLWTVLLSGKAKAGDKPMELPIEFVVVGHAPE